MTNTEIENLDAKLKNKGMIPMSSYIHGNPLQRHIGVTNLTKFGDWLEMILAETGKMNLRLKEKDSAINNKGDLDIWITKRHETFHVIGENYHKMRLAEYFEWLSDSHLMHSKFKLELELAEDDKSDTYETYLAQSSAFSEAMVNLVAAIFLESSENIAENTTLKTLKELIHSRKDLALFPTKSWFEGSQEI
ncbi:hypothetical protein QTV49_004613 [Vibrio vulnificus]|nr:hypothetical protein [Vibrio vulnificus]